MCVVHTTIYRVTLSLPHRLKRLYKIVIAEIGKLSHKLDTQEIFLKILCKGILPNGFNSMNNAFIIFGAVLLYNRNNIKKSGYKDYN